MSIDTLNKNMQKMELVDEERSNKALWLTQNIQNVTKENKLMSRDVIKKEHQVELLKAQKITHLQQNEQKDELNTELGN